MTNTRSRSGKLRTPTPVMEPAAPSPAKRQRRFLAAVAGAVLLASVMIGASQLGARSGGARATGATPPLASKGPDAALFAGIAQHGAALGSPRAAVTLVEYADLQCPYCAEWTRQTLPVVVLNYVRSGKLRIVFRGLAFIGPESQLALETAVAAAADDKLWNVVHALYRVQGAENSGWVNEALLAEVAAAAGLDYDRLAAARGKPFVAREIAGAALAAASAGVNGTPSFELGPTGGKLRPVDLRSLGPEGIVPAIEAVLARG
jgi:protein-disulfide isomerase